MLETFKPYFPQLIAAIFTLLVGAINYILRPRVKLTYGSSNQFSAKIPIDEDKKEIIVVNSRRFTICNDGGISAEDVQIVFNFEPIAFSVWPQRNYICEKNREDKYIIKINYIPPDDFILIEASTLDIEVPQIVNLIAKNGIGKETKYQESEEVSNFIIWARAVLMIIGFYSIVVFLLKMII